jgi:hypothetical protein
MAPPLTDKSLIPHPPTEGWLSMKRVLYSLLVAALPFGGVLADVLKSKNAKVTLVYQHELPNVPGKSIKRMPNPPSFTRPCSKGRSAVRSTADR